MRGRGRSRSHLSTSQSISPPPQFNFNSSRDSDASYASSRASSIAASRSATDFLINDKSSQLAAVRNINSYLSSYSFPIFLKLSPLPSAKDITETLKFLIARMDYSSGGKLEEDFPVILKWMACPIKMNKSALKAPGTPHTWPTLLAVINWLVQIAKYRDCISKKGDNTINEYSVIRDDGISSYALDSYLDYIRGDDDSVENLDEQFIQKLDKERESAEKNVTLKEKVEEELGGKLEDLRKAPPAKEALEKERVLLEGDVKKFKELIGQISESITVLEKDLEAKDKELEAKELETKRILQENEDLSKAIESQSFNARDVERMKKELQVVGSDIEEAESARSAWEEKSWDIGRKIDDKFKELEALSIEYNKDIRRLKLSSTLYYSLNRNGTTPAEVLGIDYKTTLKPPLDSLTVDIKDSKMEKLDEQLRLQQRFSELCVKNEETRKHVASVQIHISEVEGHMNLLRKEMQDYLSKCKMEAQKMVDDYEPEVQNMEIVEKEATEMLKASKLKLQEENTRCERKVQAAAYEFFVVVDQVSKYKEYVKSKVWEMKGALSATAGTVSKVYTHSLPVQYGDVFHAMV